MEQKEKLIVYSLCIDAVSPRYCQHTRRVEKKKAKHKEVLCVVESRGEPRREQGKPQKYIRIH